MKNAGRLKWGLTILFGLFLLMNFGVLRAQAAGTLYQSHFVKFSPDGKAWTMQQALPAGSTDSSPSCWYQNGETVETGRSSTLRDLAEGEHYYRAARYGEVPVGSWKVVHRYAKCIHKLTSYREFHGVVYRREICGSPYYSGWLAECADCGQWISTSLVYASREAVASVNSIDVDLDMYYLCPTCSHLEQGVSIGRHLCKSISANRYMVRYEKNDAAYGTAAGDMESSFHMYDDAEEFEGEAVTPNTHLTLNRYQITGYRFSGWNTEPDGSGESFGDGAAIQNLSSENYDPETQEGVVVLYAQWERIETNLVIDPNGGSYLGKKGTTVIRQEYGSTYRLDASEVTAPAGYRVEFETNGAGSLEPETSAYVFDGWMLMEPAGGSLFGEIYSFAGGEDDTDIAKAVYTAQPVILPLPVRENYAFGGWYRDPKCTDAVGAEGDSFLPERDTVLYAKWVELVLKSKNNETANGGKGAVDLTWSQADGKSKSYKLYQGLTASDLKLLYGAEETVESRFSSEVYGCEEREVTVTVPYTGFYSLTASGAQGGNFGGFHGGKGGSATGRFYLTAGERLRIIVGGQNGFNGGGAASAYGCGGGYSIVISDQKGTLVIGGGGGGATSEGDGGDGGKENGLAKAPSEGGCAGEDGYAGGGGGYAGGANGVAIYHKHTVSGCGYHSHSGSSSRGGGCYTKETGFYHTHTGNCVSYWTDNLCCSNCQEGPYAHYSGNPYGACNSFNPRWSRISCGYNQGWNVTGYQLNCKKTAGYQCGKTETNLESASPSYGGSSYVNRAYALTADMTAGTQEGDGIVILEALSVGFLDSQSLEGVYAPDLEPPDAVDVQSVVQMPFGENKVMFRFDAPSDRGTDYYHQAKSFEAETEQLLCVSNITKNTIISGVSGYYYLVDHRESTPVTADNAKAFSGEESILLELAGGDEESYLHIAAADVAGNLSDSVHIRIEPLNIGGGISTDRLKISGIVGGTDRGSVFFCVERNIWYVKADGATPFLLSYQSRMNGRANESCQINYQILTAQMDGEEQQLVTKIPYSVPVSYTGQLSAADFLKRSKGSIVLRDGMYAAAARSRNAAAVDFSRAFILDREKSGRTITVIPEAGADFGGQVVYSDREQDEKNALSFIADGEGPVITGLEALETERAGRQDQTLVLRAGAEDALSGVADFYIKVENSDNFGEEILKPGEDGRICLEITADDPVFAGDFTVTVFAADQVGNETALVYEVNELLLEAEVERILEPHTPVFKCGESGILKVEVRGYAERVEVEFPKELLRLCPELNRSITYEVPQYIQGETIQFMIPLYTPENNSYQITVRAYKGEKTVEKHLGVSVVEGGSVLDELRTRLR